MHMQKSAAEVVAGCGRIETSLSAEKHLIPRPLPHMHGEGVLFGGEDFQ
jgi:hypothetical protein